MATTAKLSDAIEEDGSVASSVSAGAKPMISPQPTTPTIPMAMPTGT